MQNVLSQVLNQIILTICNIQSIKLHKWRDVLGIYNKTLRLKRFKREIHYEMGLAKLCSFEQT